MKKNNKIENKTYLIICEYNLKLKIYKKHGENFETINLFGDDVYSSCIKANDKFVLTRNVPFGFDGNVSCFDFEYQTNFDDAPFVFLLNSIKKKITFAYDYVLVISKSFAHNSVTPLTKIGIKIFKDKFIGVIEFDSLIFFLKHSLEKKNKGAFVFAPWNIAYIGEKELLEKIEKPDDMADYLYEHFYNIGYRDIPKKLLYGLLLSRLDIYFRSGAKIDVDIIRRDRKLHIPFELLLDAFKKNKIEPLLALSKYINDDKNKIYYIDYDEYPYFYDLLNELALKPIKHSFFNIDILLDCAILIIEMNNDQMIKFKLKKLNKICLHYVDKSMNLGQCKDKYVERKDIIFEKIKKLNK